eukprot:Colp12_sorted_trinity150504_noHs@24923
MKRFASTLVATGKPVSCKLSSHVETKVRPISVESGDPWPILFPEGSLSAEVLKVLAEMKNTFGGTLENIEQSLKSSNESIKKIEENQAEVNMEIGQVKKTIDKNQAAVKTEFGRINKELGRIGMTSGQIGERFAKIDLAEMFGKEFAKSLHITNLVGLVLWFSRKSGSPNEMDTLVGLADKVAWALAARDGKHLPTYLKLLKFSPEQIEQFIAQLDNPTKGDSLFKLLSDVEESLKGQAGAKT